MMHATKQSSAIRSFLVMLLAITSVGATTTTTTTTPKFTTKVSMAPFVGFKKYQMCPSPSHQNHMMVIKKRRKKMDSKFVAATKDSDETSACAITVLHHENTIKKVPMTTFLISVVLFVPLDSQDCMTFRSDIYMKDDLFDT